MISKILLKNIATYGNKPAILETDKKLNFVYGLNGTGKTTLSSYLSDLNDDKFSNCSIEGLNDEKIIVYNQKFIEENFYLNPTQKGIFSLSSNNNDAIDKIEKTTKEINKINLEYKNEEIKTGYFYELDKKQQNLVILNTEYENKVWEIKTKYSGGDRILEFCLEGKKIKNTLFNYILSVQKSPEDFKISINDLKKEAELTQGEDAKIYNENDIKTIDFYFLGIEENSIFNEIIIGNENLQVANLIKILNNSDWVNKGLEFINEPKEDENEICPFCQNKTISKNLYNEIKNRRF